MHNQPDIETQLRTLRRRVMGLTCAFAALLAYTAFSTITAVHAASAPKELKLRRLTIVDDKGTERVIIAAPAPDPMIHGKREKRDGAISGILINDKDGNERGGYVTANGDSNGAFLSLDGVDAQVFTVYANPNNGATLSIGNQKGDGVIISSWNQPAIQIRQSRKLIYNQPPDAPEIR